MWVLQSRMNVYVYIYMYKVLFLYTSGQYDLLYIRNSKYTGTKFRDIPMISVCFPTLVLVLCYVDVFACVFKGSEVSMWH